MSTLIDLCEKWGIMPWSGLTPYALGAHCLASDGGIYSCTSSHSNKNPVSTTGYWKNIFIAHTDAYHVSFFARRNHSGTVTREVWLNLTGDIVRDSGGNYNPVAARFVAPRNGDYVFNATASIVGADDQTRLQVAVRVNGSVVAYGDKYSTFGTSNPQAAVTSDPIYMLSGHYAEAYVTFRNGSSPIVNSYALNLQSYANTFSGWRVS
jgi:hypothetical protein